MSLGGIFLGQGFDGQLRPVELQVPTRNFNQALSRESMERIARLLDSEGAQLWINHDLPQSSRLPRAPNAIQ